MTPVALGPLVARWPRLYADHKVVSGGVTYVHLAGILLGGGLALSADRIVLRWSSEPGPDRSRELESLGATHRWVRSEEHTSELQSPCNLVCRLLLEKKKTK